MTKRTKTQRLIAYLHHAIAFTRCKNRGCQTSENKGYVDVTAIVKSRPIEVFILPCCGEKAKIVAVRFLPKNRKAPGLDMPYAIRQKREVV